MSRKSKWNSTWSPSPKDTIRNWRAPYTVNRNRPFLGWKMDNFWNRRAPPIRLITATFNRRPVHVTSSPSITSKLTISPITPVRETTVSVATAKPSKWPVHPRQRLKYLDIQSKPNNVSLQFVCRFILMFNDNGFVIYISRFLVWSTDRRHSYRSMNERNRCCQYGHSQAQQTTDQRHRIGMGLRQSHSFDGVSSSLPTPFRTFN